MSRLAADAGASCSSSAVVQSAFVEQQARARRGWSQGQGGPVILRKGRANWAEPIDPQIAPITQMGLDNREGLVFICEICAICGYALGCESRRVRRRAR